jgi:hypothetical protein
MSHIGNQINIVIQSGLAQELKQNGFRKQARTFRKSLPEAILITNIQGNKWNLGQTGSFTMNLGVYFPVVAKLIWLPMPRVADKPFEYDCLVRARIGELLPNPGDYWWKIEPSTNLRTLASNVTQLWKAHGKPWLEHHAQLSHARDSLVRQGLQWQAAVFSYVMGETELATDQLRNAAESATRRGNTRFVGVLEDWARSHQLVW